MAPKKKKDQPPPAPPPPPAPDLSAPVLQDLGKLNPSSRNRIGMLPTAASLAPPVSPKEAPSELANTGDAARYGRRASPDGVGGARLHYAEPTNYHAHDVKEYRKLQQQYITQRWGGLGFVDTDEQKQAREKRAKVHEYGNCVSLINAAILKASSPEPDAGGGGEAGNGGLLSEKPSAAIQRKLTEEAEIAKLKRDRALNFYDNLDRRQRGGRESVGVAGRGSPALHMSPSPSRDREPFNDVQSTPLAPEQQDALEQLQALLQKHRKDQEVMVRIKRELGMVTPTPQP